MGDAPAEMELAGVVIDSQDDRHQLSAICGVYTRRRELKRNQT